jgi:serine/threonine-protein kinase
MLSGQPLFRGETTAHIIAEVLKSEPDWAVLPASTPAEVRDLIERCLRKQPRSRLRDIGDARVLIEEWRARPEKSRFAIPPAGTASRNGRLMTLSVVSALVAAVAIGSFLWSRRVVVTAPSRTWEFPLGDYDVRYEFYDAPVIAPDGSMIAFSGAGKGPLRVRDTNALEPRTLAGTEGAIMPLWSPDSREIAYTIVQPDMKTIVWKVAARGGTPIKVCEAPRGALWGAAWLPDHQLLLNVVYGPADGDFFVVPDGGGTPMPFPAGDEKGAPVSPVPLSNGDLLYGLVINLQTQPVVLRGESPAPHVGAVIDFGAFGMAYASGHLLHVRRNRPGLWATPFDLDQIRATGPSHLIAPDGMYPSVAADGTLVYKRRVGGTQQLAWVDRAGNVLGSIGVRHEELVDPALSPDGSRVAVVALDQGVERAVWTYDVARGARSRIDFGTSNLSALAWAPGGDRLAATADWNIVTQSMDASGPPRVVSGRDKVEEQPSWSRDGRYLFFDTYDGGADIWYVDVTQGSEPQKLLGTPAFEGYAVLSPDGKHIASTANESGRDEVFVREFPSLQKKHQVSVNGGREARWSAGGDELFFVAGATLMAATVERGPALVTSVPKPLFTAEKIGATTMDYDVAPDGKRFVVVRTIQPRERRAVVVENWRSRLASTPWASRLARHAAISARDSIRHLCSGYGCSSCFPASSSGSSCSLPSRSRSPHRPQNHDRHQSRACRMSA